MKLIFNIAANKELHSPHRHYERGTNEVIRTVQHLSKAVLSTISTSPNAAGSFLVRADISDKGKLGNQVTQGMTGEVSIILEDKTIFDHLFRVFLEKTSFD